MKTQLEIERKFIIKKPDIAKMRPLPGFTESEIEQIYLENTEDGATHRIRARCFLGKAPIYTETLKRRVSGMSAMESEREITHSEYAELKKEIKVGTAPVKKNRYTVLYAGHTLEIDLFCAWKSSCIMEIELSSEQEEFALPPFLEIIREVTGDIRYTNHAMSKEFPQEDAL